LGLEWRLPRRRPSLAPEFYGRSAAASVLFARAKRPAINRLWLWLQIEEGHCGNRQRHIFPTQHAEGSGWRNGVQFRPCSPARIGGMNPVAKICHVKSSARLPPAGAAALIIHQLKTAHHVLCGVSTSWRCVVSPSPSIDRPNRWSRKTIAPKKFVGFEWWLPCRLPSRLSVHFRRGNLSPGWEDCDALFIRSRAKSAQVFSRKRRVPKRLGKIAKTMFPDNFA